jgi:hypothetical protein
MLNTFLNTFLNRYPFPIDAHPFLKTTVVGGEHSVAGEHVCTPSQAFHAGHGGGNPKHVIGLSLVDYESFVEEFLVRGLTRVQLNVQDFTTDVTRCVRANPIAYVVPSDPISSHKETEPREHGFVEEPVDLDVPHEVDIVRSPCWFDKDGTY